MTQLLTYGINHHTAPLRIREQLTFDTSGTSHALQELLKLEAVNEAVIISTCNRTEIYSASQQLGPLQHWLTQQHSLTAQELNRFTYSYQGIDTVRHLMRVASGLDSMVLGEPQILGQIKQAYHTACDAGAVGQQLKHLFPAVFETSKHIRSHTDIGVNPISMAYAVTQLAKRIFSDIKKSQVLLIGAGDMIELTATHLKSLGVKHITIANRSIEKAQVLAQQINAHAIRIGDIPALLKDIDIIVTATASQLPILGKGLIESSLKLRKHRPMFLADLAVPRDIEPEVSQLEDAYLYNIDDLQTVIEDNQKHRKTAAEQAETMIEMQAQHYMQQRRVFDAGQLITQYRQQLENMRDQELAKARQQLSRGTDPSIVIETLARGLTNKVLHQPTIKLRQAAAYNQVDLLMLAKELLNL